MASNLSSQDGDLGFQVAPMVDIVFVLMLFFMACAGAMVEERHLSIQLPSGRVQSIEPTAIVIAIGDSGDVRVNDLNVAAPSDQVLPKLKQWLQAARAFGSDDLVFIQPEMSVRHERIMQVLAAVNSTGVAKVSFR